MNNSPAWLLPQDRVIFARRLPLFVQPFATELSTDPCPMSCATTVMLPVAGHAGVFMPHLWGCGAQGLVTLLAIHLQPAKIIESFNVSNASIIACTVVPGRPLSANGDCITQFGCSQNTVWMVTCDGR